MRRVYLYLRNSENELFLRFLVEIGYFEEET